MKTQDGIERKLGVEQPGDQLLLVTDPIELVVRATRLRAKLGLISDALVTRAVAGLSLPIVTGGAALNPRRAVPEWIWHPLLWLPERLSSRLQVDDVIEDQDAWMVRVCMELTTAGLYDPADGTWVDMLALIGLDAGRDADRIDAWCAGAPDADLDALSVEDYLDHDDPTWAFDVAQDMAPVLRDIAAGRVAEVVGEAVRDELATNNPDGPDRQFIIGYGVVADSLLSGPDDPDLAGVLRRLSDYDQPLGSVDSPAWDLVETCEHVQGQYRELEDHLSTEFETEYADQLPRGDDAEDREQRPPRDPAPLST